jgi:hypothetical protein
MKIKFCIIFLVILSVHAYSQLEIPDNTKGIPVRITRSSALTGGYQDDDGNWIRFFEPMPRYTGNLTVTYNRIRAAYLPNPKLVIEEMIFEFGVDQIFFSFYFYLKSLFTA